MTTKPVISKLPHPEHHGDWHDKPCRWQVTTGTEVQKFSTRADARLYAACRAAARTELDAGRAFLYGTPIPATPATLSRKP